MQLTIERSALLKALGHVQSVVERRNTYPILANVLFKASDDHVELRATDLDIEVTESVPAMVGQSGTTTVPAHTLYEIVRKLADGAEVRLETEGGDVSTGHLVNAAGAWADEVAVLAGLRPRFAGAITFSAVDFTYPGSRNAALNEITFDVPAGTMLGQQLTHLDDDPGDLCLLLPRQHPSWCDTSHNPLES